MAGRRGKFPNISTEQAHAALRWLHALRRVSTADIHGALRERDELVTEIRARLEALGGEGLRFLNSVEGLQRRASAKAKRRRGSAKAWEAQGRYINAVRRLSKADRLKVRAIREKNGVPAAILAARKLGKPKP